MARDMKLPKMKNKQKKDAVFVLIKQRCAACGGAGGKQLVCKNCDGYGKNYIDDYGTKHWGESCPYCSQDIYGDTTGTVWDECEECGGHGHIMEEEVFVHNEILTLLRISTIDENNEDFLKDALLTHYRGQRLGVIDITVRFITEKDARFLKSH